MTAVEVIYGYFGIDASAVNADIVAVEAGDAVENSYIILYLTARGPHHNGIASQGVAIDGVVGAEHAGIGTPKIMCNDPIKPPGHTTQGNGSNTEF